MTKNKELLTNVGNTEVLVGRLGITWLNPELNMIIDGKEIAMTTDAGEFSNDFGEFVVDKESFTDLELDHLTEVLNEIAEEDSLVHFENFGFTKFTLKKDYLDKLENMHK